MTTWARVSRAVTGISDRRQQVGGQMIRPDQSVIDFAVSPLPDGATLITFVDVTDSKRYEQTLLDSIWFIPLIPLGTLAEPPLPSGPAPLELPERTRSIATSGSTVRPMGSSCERSTSRVHMTVRGYVASAPRFMSFSTGRTPGSTNSFDSIRPP
jgi:hypothetical protein